MKQVLYDFLDFSGFAQFVYSGVMGILAMFNIIELNPAVFITATGGFIWACMKSWILYRDHKLKAASQDKELQMRQLEIDEKRMDVCKKKAEVEALKTKIMTYNQALYLRPEIYKRAGELEEEYRRKISELIKEEEELRKSESGEKNIT